MKKIYILFSVMTALLFIRSSSVYSQAGSVELQDGGGVFISSHASIEEAYNAIPGTITGAYIIEILAAYDGSLELFPIDLRLKSGHSSSNTITIRPDAGNTGEVISSTGSSGILNIHAADYIIIDGRPGGTGSSPDLEIRNSSTGSNANTVNLDSGASNCVIKYIKAYNATNGTTGPKCIKLGPSPNIPGGCADNLIDRCYVNGGRTGIGTDGSTGATANAVVNTVISNCTVENFGFVGIWLLNLTSHTTIEDCVINGTGTSSNIANVTAINIQSTFDGYVFNIRRNKITNFIATSTSTSLAPRGIATITAPGTGSVLNIENNFIAMTADNLNAATTYGIFTTGTSEIYTCNIFYNTILIGGTQTGGVSGRIVSAGIVKQSTVAGVVYNQKNNICINNRTGGTPGVIHAGCAINGTDGIIDLDYNIYYASGSSEGANSYPASWDSVHYDDLATYKSVSGEDHTRFKNVSFISNSDLHLDGSSVGDGELAGIPIIGITNDIDSEARSTTNPYRGADESTAFVLSNLNLTLNLEACSPMQDTVTVLLRSVSAPYELVDSAKGYLNAGGTVSLNFVKPVNGVNYYIVAKHRNSIETWSKTGGEVFTAGALSYDMTTSASQAYGNNQILVGSKYSVYTGDVDQSGNVDLTDIVGIYNDANLFVTGYAVTDLNCNSIVDLTDLLFAYNNSSNFVSIQRP